MKEHKHYYSRAEMIKRFPEGESQTWGEYKIKRSVKARRKSKDRQSSVL